MPGNANTHDQILDLAQQYIQERGYNAFSFRDLAIGIGIKSSSIHYYYPSKGHLALAVTSRYRKNFAEAATQLRENNAAPQEILKGYAQIFQSTLEDGGKMCLCAMLASDCGSVDDSVAGEVKAFFAEQYEWLADVIAEGISQGSIRSDIVPEKFAILYFSALEGAMMVAKANDNAGDIKTVADQMIGLTQ